LKLYIFYLLVFVLDGKTEVEPAGTTNNSVGRKETTNDSEPIEIYHIILSPLALFIYFAQVVYGLISIFFNLKQN